MAKLRSRRRGVLSILSLFVAGLYLKTFLTNKLSLVPLIQYFTTGAMLNRDSKVNFIGSVSFEGNNVNRSGGKGKFVDILFQQNDKHEHTLLYFSAIDKKSCYSVERNTNRCTALTF